VSEKIAAPRHGGENVAVGEFDNRWESFEFFLTTKRLIEHEVMKPDLMIGYTGYI
jgi:hypothetical protein